jgi:hypothetical protein
MAESPRTLTAVDPESPAPGLPAPENPAGPEQAGPAQYRAINAAYGALLAGLLVGTRGRDAETERLQGAELLPLGAATFAISKTIAREKIGSWVREPFVEDPVEGRRPRGGRVRRAVGELVTCSRCVGAWTALGLVSLRLAHPRTGRTVTAVFATAAINDFAQAGFRALCERANSVARTRT